MTKKLVYIIQQLIPTVKGGHALKFYNAKYLSEQGFQVDVLTQPPFAEIDKSYLKKIPKNMKIHYKSSKILDKIYALLYKLHLVPFNGIEWDKSVSDKFLKELNPDFVVTACPPITALNLGARIKKLTGAKLIYDYWDDLADVIDARNGWLGKKIAHNVEKKLLEQADLIAVKTEQIKKNLIRRYNIDEKKIKVIYLGYFPGKIKKITKEKKFTITYAGVIAREQKPEMLNLALKKLFEKHPELKGKVQARFFGKKTSYFPEFEKTLIPGASEYLGVFPVEEAQARIKTSNLGFVPLAEDTYAYAIPQKVFDYIAMEVPILASVPEGGECMNLINKYKIGRAVNMRDNEKLADTIYEIYTKKQDEEIIKNEKKLKKFFSAETQMKILSDAIKRL